jgi:DNA excision repair protein ERCC-5
MPPLPAAASRAAQSSNAQNWETNGGEEESDIDGSKGGAAEAFISSSQSTMHRADASVDMSVDMSTTAEDARDQRARDEALKALAADDVTLRADKKRFKRDTEGVSENMQDDIIALLELFGLPYVISPSEAEAQCASLELLGLVEGTITNDSDVWLFGGRTVYRNIFDDQKYVETYKAEDVERELGLGRGQMICLALLLGSDYTTGIKGVGIVNATEILASFAVKDSDDDDDVEDGAGGTSSLAAAASSSSSSSSNGKGTAPLDHSLVGINDDAVKGGFAALRGFKEWVHSTKASDFGIPLSLAARNKAEKEGKDVGNQPAKLSAKEVRSLGALARFKYSHRTARTTWKVGESFPDPNVAMAYLKPEVDASTDAFSFELPDLDGIRHFCRDRLQWSDLQTDEHVLPVLKSLNERTYQTRVDSHFVRYEDTDRAARIQSKRMRRALGGLSHGASHALAEHGDTMNKTKTAKKGAGVGSTGKGKGKGPGQRKGKRGGNGKGSGKGKAGKGKATGGTAGNETSTETEGTGGTIVKGNV